jgi:hypothetical protein
MRRAMTGWIVVAVGFVGLGIGALVGAQAVQVRDLPAATIHSWRQYADEVERGTRTPSGVTTRLLTETAIAQRDHAKSAVDLLRLVGAGVTLLGVFLAVDLIRYRARHASEVNSSARPA